MGRTISQGVRQQKDAVKAKQDQVLEYMCQYCETSGGRPPTIREIGRVLNIKSTSMITHYLLGLERRGLVERHRHVGQTQSARAWWVRGGTWRRPQKTCQESLSSKTILR
jgi:repressor LexA